MKTSVIVLLLPLAALAAPSTQVATTTVAVSTFQSDAATSSAIGSRDAGISVAHILASDLAALSPLVVVDADETAQSPQGLAATVVTGRVSMDGSDTLLTARVTPPGMARPMETTVRTEKSTSIADAVSLLAMQVGKIALSQRGTEAPAWIPAAIVGTARSATLFTFQEVASVMSIDGVAIADETQTWNKERPLLPGLHSIFVRYYDGTATAGHSFTLFAKPGVQYAVSYDRASGENPRLWISEKATGKPVTAIAMASVGDPARVIQGMVDVDSRGLFSPNNNPAFVRKVASSGK
jgi:hypothetical protein